MPTTLVQVAYRPVRVGWLVRGRSKNDMRDTLRLASCLWGGSFGFLVDAAGDPEVVDTAIGRFRADVLHATVETQAARSVIERNSHLAWPLFGDGVLSSDHPVEPGLVDISRSLGLRSDAAASMNSVVPVWEHDDELALVYAATFGDLAHPTLGPKQRASFMRVTGAVEVSASQVAAAFDNHEVPLDATRAGLGWLPPRFEWRSLAGVFVGSATSLTDVRSYWNVRAVGAEVVFWDSRDVAGGAFRAVVDARIQAAASVQQDAPDNFRVFPCYIAAGRQEARSQMPAELLESIEGVGLSPSITRIVGDVGIASWIPRGVQRLPTMPGESVVAHTEDRGEERSRVTIALPRTPFDEYDGWPRQELAIQVESHVDSGYRGTLKLPYLPDLNGWYRWHISGALENLRVHDGSFALITAMLGPTLDLTPLQPRLLLEKLFERAGINASRSLPGEAAWHLLPQFGGYGGLRALRLPGVRKLLSSTAARSGITRKAARDLINDRGRINEADTIWIGGDQLDAAQVWEFLLHRRIFLPGVETKCPWCRHSSFYRPRDVEDELQCPKCGRQFPLGPAIAGDPVRFRMSGLLEPRPEGTRDGDADADGVSVRQPAAVPVLLTLLFLTEWTAGGDGALFDTSNDLSGDGIETCETDLVAVSYGARPDQHTHILVGECKGRGYVTAEDVRKLTAVSNRIKGSGSVDCDVVFSTTRDAFTEDELALFRQYHLASSEHEFLRRAPILLTARELDFHRYAPRSRVPTGAEFRGTGFSPLVSWCTRELIARQPPSLDA